MTHHSCEQYGEEWVRLRLGKPTASGFHYIFTPTGVPTKVGVTRRRYMHRLVAERLLRQAMDDGYESKSMKRGSELEDEARKTFEAKTGHVVRKAGFFTTGNNRLGASPDGVLDNGDVAEIKCPLPHTHVGYLMDGLGDYKPQIQGQMLVCGAKRVHFWSYHPSMPSFYEVLERDTEYIAKLHVALTMFCDQIDAAEKYCRGLGTFHLAEKLRLSDELEMTVGDILEDL